MSLPIPLEVALGGVRDFVLVILARPAVLFVVGVDVNLFLLAILFELMHPPHAFFVCVCMKRAVDGMMSGGG